MAVITLKPHRLSYLVTTPGHEDDNGNYYPGKSEWEGDIPCDAVPASGEKEERMFEDGVIRAYSFEITLGADCPTFATGDRVRLSLYRDVVKDFEVKGFIPYQTQCKMWV